MALQFKGGGLKSPGAKQTEAAPNTQGGQPAQSAAPQQFNKPASNFGAKPTGGIKKPSFLMTGQASLQAMEKAEAQAEAARADAGKPWRFFIPGSELGKTRKIVFLDGDLDNEGILIMQSWYEHALKINNRPEQYICTNHDEACPICNSGDTPLLVAGFAVLDLQPYVIKNGPKAGQTVPVSRKLLIAKRRTASQLMMLAPKTEGLRGVLMDAMRTTTTSASVGDVFIPDSKYEQHELIEQYGDLAKPFDPAEDLSYKTAAELVQLGVAEAVQTIKSNAAPSADLVNNL